MREIPSIIKPCYVWHANTCYHVSVRPAFIMVQLSLVQLKLRKVERSLTVQSWAWDVHRCPLYRINHLDLGKNKLYTPCLTGKGLVKVCRQHRMTRSLLSVIPDSWIPTILQSDVQILSQFFSEWGFCTILLSELVLMICLWAFLKLNYSS